MENKYKAFGLSFLLLCFLHQYSILFRSIINFCGIGVMLLIFAWELGPFLSTLLFKPFLGKVDPKGKAILITGCDSGFGHRSALLLNKMGFKVYAGCLFPDAQGAQSLKEKASQPDKLIVVKMDVLSDEDIDSVYKTITSTLDSKNGEKLWGLVNNAGILRMAPIELGDFNYFVSDQFAINVFGVVKVTRKFGPLIRQAKGRIVILSSIASRLSLTPLAAYCMSKHSIAAFCDCLRDEMEHSNVKVTSIEPYFYGTDMVTTSSLNPQDDRCWNNSTEDARQAFGHSTYKKFIKDFLSLLRLGALGANQDPSEVSRTVAKALTDPEPPFRYICSSPYIKPLLLLGPLVPREVLLYFFNHIFNIASNQLEKAKAK